jgi:hypothetical protein
LLLAAAGCAFAQSAQPEFGFLESSWCTAPHDDYRPGRYVVDIRQIRQIRVLSNPGSPNQVLAQVRSAMVDVQTGQVDFAGGWMEFTFSEVAPLTLRDPVVDATLSIGAEHDRLVYGYGDARAHAYSRCGPASVQLSEKAPLPAAIAIARVPAKTAPPPAAGQADPGGNGGHPPAQTDEPRKYANLSDCLSLDKTRAGLLGLRNRCPNAANYIYCLLNPSTRNGRLFVCRTVQGQQIGQGSGIVEAGNIGYLGLPAGERGRVVWFACQSPGIPALTSANPPRGHCR